MITVGVSADLETNYHAGNIVKRTSQKEIKVVVVETQVCNCRWKKNLQELKML